MDAWSLIVGACGLAFGVAQLLAALGRVELDHWPFVRTESRGLRLAGAAFWMVIGVVLLVSAAV